MIECEICKTPFAPRNKVSKYCSKPCANRAENKARRLKYRNDPQFRKKNIAASRRSVEAWMARDPLAREYHLLIIKRANLRVSLERHEARITQAKIRASQIIQKITAVTKRIEKNKEQRALAALAKAA